MHGTAAIRIALLGAALAFTLPASADADLDAFVNDHVMPSFNQQARVFIRKSGARFVSTAWNGNTRTLIAVGKVERAAPRERKSDHVDQICRHPMANMITRFLEKYDVKMALIYNGKQERADVVEISHVDLQTCV